MDVIWLHPICKTVWNKKNHCLSLRKDKWQQTQMSISQLDKSQSKHYYQDWPVKIKGDRNLGRRAILVMQTICRINYQIQNSIRITWLLQTECKWLTLYQSILWDKLTRSLRTYICLTQMTWAIKWLQWTRTNSHKKQRNSVSNTWKVLRYRTHKILTPTKKLKQMICKPTSRRMIR